MPLAQHFRRFAALLLCAGLSHFGFAQDAAFKDLLAAAEGAEKRGEVSKALEHYLAAEKLEPENAHVLQKVAKQLSDSVSELRDRRAQRDVTLRALAYSERAVALEPKNPACVLSVAICYGKLAQIDDVSARVGHARNVQRFANEALALDPSYDWAHHVLGRWHYELLQIGGPSRAMARMLYGGWPRASAEEAIAHLKRATELAPQTSSHWLELGFSYLAAGNRKNALDSFRHGMRLPSQERQDMLSKERVHVILPQLEKEFAGK